MRFFNSFFVFGKKFDAVHINQVSIFSCDILSRVSDCEFPKDIVEWHDSYHK